MLSNCNAMSQERNSICLYVCLIQSYKTDFLNDVYYKETFTSFSVVITL